MTANTKVCFYNAIVMTIIHKRVSPSLRLSEALSSTACLHFLVVSAEQSILWPAAAIFHYISLLIYTSLTCIDSDSYKQ